MNIILTHSDFDGAVCAILFKQVFPEGKVFKGTYANINDIFRTQIVESKEKLENVFITDISLKEDEFKDYLESHKNLHFIDHHPRETPSLIKNQLHSIKASGCYLTLKYLQKNFNYVPTKAIENLVKFGNDYDTWKHDFKISKIINRLYYFYSFEKFLERFKNGFSEFLPSEKDFIVKNNNYLQDLFKKTEYLKVAENVYFIMVTDAIDEVADYFFKINPALDTVFILNSKNNSLSMRGKHEIDYGKFLIPFGGGGHPNAAAVKIKNPNETFKIIETFLEERAKDDYK